MYAKLALKNSKGQLLKQYHHVNLTTDFLLDCKVWLTFLKSPDLRLCRPFIDFFDKEETHQRLFFYSDASKNTEYGIGAVFNDSWVAGIRPKHFIAQADPSIEFLELYALTFVIVTWQKDDLLRNRRVTLFCDNESVMYMVNQSTSSCSQC